MLREPLLACLRSCGVDLRHRAVCGRCSSADVGETIMKFILPIALGCFMSISAYSHESSQPDRYYLDKLPGVEGVPTAINRRGDVTGEGFRDGVGGDEIGFYFQRNRFVDLNTNPDVFVSSAAGVNDRRQVVGLASVRDEQGTMRMMGFIWKRGKFEFIGDLPGGLTLSAATAVNNQGQVIGYSDSNVGTECILWEKGSVMSIGRPFDLFFCIPSSINEFGTIVGGLVTSEATRPFRWREGTLTPLPLPPGATSGFAVDVNELGVVLISYSDATSDFRGAIHARGRFKVLPNLPGFQGSIVAAINNWGDVVGASINPEPFDVTAVVWRRGVPVVLDTLIADDEPLKPCVTLLHARAVNDRGQIAAFGADRCEGTFSRVFRLTPARHRHKDK
jgi:probable HAF family extracellular repeat protein